MPPTKNGAYSGISTRSSSGSCAACATADVQRPSGENRTARPPVRAGQDFTQREQRVEADLHPQRPAHAQHPVRAQRLLAAWSG